MLTERKTLHFKETVMGILYKAIRVKRFDSGCSYMCAEEGQSVQPLQRLPEEKSIVK